MGANTAPSGTPRWRASGARMSTTRTSTRPSTCTRSGRSSTRPGASSSARSDAPSASCSESRKEDLKLCTLAPAGPGSQAALKLPSVCDLDDPGGCYQVVCVPGTSGSGASSSTAAGTAWPRRVRRAQEGPRGAAGRTQGNSRQVRSGRHERGPS
eukprot:9261239-Pyramimonas_sp.AAC.1